MSFEQFFLVLRARRRLIFITLLSMLMAAIAMSLLLPKTYKATTSLVLNFKDVDPVTGSPSAGQGMPGYMAIIVATQADIIKSMTCALAVVDALQLASSPEVQEEFARSGPLAVNIRDWLAAGLLRRLTVDPVRDSNVFTVSYKDQEPRRAAVIANAFASAYQTLNVRLNVEPSAKAASYFNDQLHNLRTEVERAHHKVSKYQQETGLVNVNGPDFESARLNELSLQLVTVQSQLMEANSRGQQASGGAEESPDIITNPLIQRLKSDLATAETKLAMAAEKYTAEHPQYQGAVAEVGKLRAALAAQTKTTSKGVGNNAKILQQREIELRAALAVQKEKVLRLNLQQIGRASCRERVL